jgi:eukaryotic-like serine/threonine-protein kinase
VTRLGPYEVLSRLGAGGMGEVYRARDPRLGREVAIKVLPADLELDPDRLRRFEQEARAAGALNHENIVTVLDTGVHDGAPYVVFELLEGQTLRQRLGPGRLPLRKALDYAVQIARGLAAAHERGIVHRDLKPENVWVASDGRVKVLDFGLAKLRPDLEPRKADEGTASEITAAGTILGTAGYMSPEQIRGETADPRSDIFSLGAVLYEMLSGHRAFEGTTSVETMAAVLRRDPTDLALARPDVPAAVGRIAARCLEKRPVDRFHSAHDLALALDAFAGGGGTTVKEPARPRTGRWMAAMLALVPIGIVAGLVVGRGTTAVSPPSFRQLTFRRGHVASARFMPDEQTVVYSAAWDGAPPQLFEARLDSPDPRPLDFGPAHVFGTLPGEVLVLFLGSPRYGVTGTGALGVGYPATLARLPLGGGRARELVGGITDASISPDGSRVAVLRLDGGRSSLEFPLGTRIYETGGVVNSLRVSPDGRRVAFVMSPSSEQPPRSLMVASAEGTRLLSSGWTSILGLAWSPSGREVWFTGAREGLGYSQELHAVDLTGQEHVILSVPGRLILHDISRGGRALLAQDHRRSELYARGPGEAVERDVSWLGFSILGAISPDGTTVLFSEEGGTSGPNGSVCLRHLADAAPIRLGEGWGMDLSADGTQALTRLRKPVSRLALLSTGAGGIRLLPPGGVIDHDWAWFFPDGRRILIQGREQGKRTRLYVQPLASGVPTAVTEEGTETTLSYPLSPDGEELLVASNGRWATQHLGGGTSRPIPGSGVGEEPVRFAADGHSVFLWHAGDGWPVVVTKRDLRTGHDQPWLKLRPPDVGGAVPLSAAQILLTPDGRSYAYQVHRSLTDLYLVDGLR